MDINFPIFLHMLNRELRETERVYYSDFEIYKIIIISCLMTNSYIYVGDALVWECYDLYPKSIDLLRLLEENGLAYFLGTDADINSFLTKRRRLYIHDRKRYPVYFVDDITKLPWASNHRIIESDTTTILARTLFDIANGFDLANNIMFSNQDKDIIAKRLEYRRRNHIAVTYSLFKDQKFSEESRLNLKRCIIKTYNKRYLDALNGRLMTGIKGLGYYDQIQGSGLFYDYRLHFYLFSILGFVNTKTIFSNRYVFDFLNLKLTKSDLFKSILLEIKKVICGFNYMKLNNHNYLNILKSTKYQITGSLDQKLNDFRKYAYQLCQNNDLFKEGYMQMNTRSKTKYILILSASPLEYKVLREVAIDFGYSFMDKTLNCSENFSYAECIAKENIKLFLARTDVGSINSTVVVQKLIEELKVEYVIMGGICAGMRPDEQRLGDVIISSQVHDYNLSKKTEIQRISRGNTITPNKYLYDRFLLESFDSKYNLSTHNVSTGLYISSDTLVNSQSYINTILSEYPDAKGYEMEGTGLMYACQLLMDKWILIKAICDWGYDKTDNYQKTAAENSYQFIFCTINNKIKDE